MNTQPIDGEIVTETAIVPQVHLGSIAVRNPKDMVSKATEMADALAEIINRQNLFKVISGRKYVMVEGWTTLGAMMGIVPVEEYCQPLPESTGFEAKVKLIRASDGGTVGAASAECSRTESIWANRDSYAVRSMSITRATGKAYRLSFSWIMKLAGFEATPAEEMDGIQPQHNSPPPATEKPQPAAKQTTGKSLLLIGHGKITNTELATGKKGEFMRVWQEGNKMQAFENPQLRLQDGTAMAFFTMLKVAKGKEAIFRVNKAGNYFNIVGVEKLGNLEWDEAGAPVIHR